MATLKGLKKLQGYNGRRGTLSGVDAMPQACPPWRALKRWATSEGRASARPKLRCVVLDRPGRAEARPSEVGKVRFKRQVLPP